jgi:hypothetical protein
LLSYIFLLFFLPFAYPAPSRLPSYSTCIIAGAEQINIPSFGGASEKSGLFCISCNLAKVRSPRPVIFLMAYVYLNN